MASGIKTRHTLDKVDWGPGPWQDEPDEAVWFHPPFACRVWRHPDWGMLNGYVGVPRGHPLYGQDHRHVDDMLADIDVHGGLTFTGTEQHQDNDIWWFGFDTHHFQDWAPAFQARQVRLNRLLLELPSMPPSMFDRLHYWTFDEVVAETEHLYEQLRNLI